MRPNGRPVGTPFKPEQSGNPAGRRPVPNIHTRIKCILEDDKPGLTASPGAIATASGEVAAARCGDHRWPASFLYRDAQSQLLDFIHEQLQILPCRSP